MTSAYRSRFLRILAGQPGPDDAGQQMQTPDIQAFLETLDGWRLTGWVYTRSRDVPGLLPAAAMEHARARYAHNVKTNLVRIAELGRIEDAFKTQDIRCLIVKGIALITEVYGDPGARPMSDMDMIVRPERETSAGALLRTLGYTQDTFHPTVFTRRDVTIDLKSEPFGVSRIQARGDTFAAALPMLWSRCKRLEAGSWYETWNGSARLFTLCIHGLKHGLPDGIWLTDIGEVLKQMGRRDWKDAIRLFKQTSSQDVLAITLGRVQDFGYTLPSYASCWLQRQPRSSRVRLTRHLARNESTRFLAESAYLVLKQQNTKARIQYLVQALFPNPAIYEHSGIPDNLSMFRPAHRIFKILTQTAGAVVGRSRGA